MIEATRRILIHDYETDDAGYITRANLIVSTGQNNLSMDIGVRETAKALIKGEEVIKETKEPESKIPVIKPPFHSLNYLKKEQI